MTRGVKPQMILPASAVEIGRPPSWLGKEARAEWRRIAPILNDRKVLTEGDLGTVQSYCVAFGVMVQAQKQINKDGILLGGKKHPALGTLNAAQTTMRLAANELGLTPISRSRAAMRENEDDDSLLD
jgi:P27 family predicted phage terminase small subunit